MPTPLKRLAERIHQRIDRVERHRPEWRKGQVTSVDPLRVDGVRAGNVSGHTLAVDDVVWMLVGHGRRQVVGVTSEHDHDARYVEVSGDTMTGVLALDDGTGAVWVELRRDRSGTQHVHEFRAFGDDLLIRMSKGGTAVSELWLRDGEVEVVDADFNVTGGAKNAVLADPADPTRAYCYAAMEADEPGLLCTRLTVTVPDGSGQTTTPLPGHWARIARDADAWATPRSGDGVEQRDGRAWPRASVDLTVPEVSVHAPPGEYCVLVMACRSDLDGRWSHEVAVDPEPGDV